MARLNLQAKDGGRSYQLTERLTTLGRSPASTIMVEDNSCSRKHCMIKKELDTFTIIDLSSANGVYVNGEKVKEHTLRSDDRIKIGSTTLIFKEDQ